MIQLRNIVGFFHRQETVTTMLRFYCIIFIFLSPAVVFAEDEIPGPDILLPVTDSISVSSAKLREKENATLYIVQGTVVKNIEKVSAAVVIIPVEKENPEITELPLKSKTEPVAAVSNSEKSSKSGSFDSADICIKTPRESGSHILNQGKNNSFTIPSQVNSKYLKQFSAGNFLLISLYLFLLIILLKYHFQVPGRAGKIYLLSSRVRPPPSTGND